jgi:hypothetical protein
MACGAKASQVLIFLPFFRSGRFDSLVLQAHERSKNVED